MDHILLIDTSAETGTVALATGGKVVSQRSSSDSRNFAAIINGLIDQVLAEENIKASDLSAIAVCGGPGSYTGLRIGLSTAKGLCYALDKPLMMHNRLFLLVAQQYYKNLLKYDNYTAILPARDKEFFITTYNNKLQAVQEPTHAFEADIQPILAETAGTIFVTGSQNPYLESLSADGRIHVEPNDILDIHSWAHYAFQQLDCNGFVNLANSEPFYLKDVYTHNSNKTNTLNK
ncbi:tRNA (adenosine(37)-N6)-threonylcarbamoyltransferase complex dimerization subunit type 1 TsaB [Polluticoccus soli]|uniref:tRNA (adenosine(37)-N6)-threonylcarbamoyltransferase complex dimerization subunit type 1 TsaB n=1 Tax=Polluticoccus soli TaxID=3034150 RepID=UPI0023E092A6|nr:tRNA (adenosine(37)-N6)-threonylcarbamoyltransferase complex dimerization subunit type 1 TsaB [Flavipsychrobacter sp. JY13-12]